MAGEVGRAVGGRPNYGGYIPSWSMPQIETGCGPNKAVPLKDRHTPSQPPKLTGPGQTIYGTDGLQRTQAGYAARAAASPHRQELPSKKEFISSSTQQDANLTVTKKPTDTTFFSRMAKEEAQAWNSGPVEHDRKTEAKSNSRKGRGGAAGLSCLHQPPKVSANTDVLVESPKSFRACATFGPNEQRDLAGDTTSASDFVKFTGRTFPATSYATEYGARGSNPRGRQPRRPQEMAEFSVTCDLAAGTAKSMPSKRIPGYMGHCPAHDSNTKKVQGDDDAVAKFHKASLLVSSKHGLPGYGGHQPQSIFNDHGKPLCPEPGLSTTGTFNKYVNDDTIEKGMNTRDQAKSNELKAFFTTGDGVAGQDCDMYFVQFRPMEGLMKAGSACESRWISDEQLRRNHISTGGQ